MNRKKLSPEEIRVLRSNAEKERTTHAEVMKNIKAVTMSPQLQMTTLLSSYERGRKDEILALLQAHTTENRKYELSAEVKLFIYKHGDELQNEKKFMLKNNHLGYEIEKLLFDDKYSPFFLIAGRYIGYPKFCANSEVYMVKESLKECLKVDRLTNELHFLDEYTMYIALSSAGEIALMEFLSATHGRDSTLDALCNFVKNYIVRHRNINPMAWLKAIQYGNHDVIMHLIRYATLTDDVSVVNALIERADEEEITSYFSRWAKEG